MVVVVVDDEVVANNNVTVHVQVEELVRLIDLESNYWDDPIEVGGNLSLQVWLLDLHTIE